MQPFELRSRATAERLAAACRDAGHEVEIVYLPWSDVHSVRQLAAYRWIDLASSSDRVVCLDLPALVVPHPRKSVWMTQPAACVSGHIEGSSHVSADELERRAVVSEIERSALAEAAAVYATERCSIRQTPQPADTRLLRLPPVPAPERETVLYDGDFVCLGSITASSRVEVIIDALALGHSRARVRFLGDFDDPDFEQRIRERVRTKNVGDVVTFEAGGSDSVKVLARSAAVIQLGACCDDLLVAAARRAKAVLASSEALASRGLACETTQPVEPSADALADAIAQLAADRSRARELGMTAAESLDTILPTWDTVATQLLQ